MYDHTSSKLAIHQDTRYNIGLQDYSDQTSGELVIRVCIDLNEALVLLLVWLSVLHL